MFSTHRKSRKEAKKTVKHVEGELSNTLGVDGRDRV